MTAAHNILLIGGSGFVSGTLARLAVGAGHTVTAVTRGQRDLPGGVRSLVADRKERAAFATAVRRASTHWDLVVDCIGFGPDDTRQDVELFRDRASHLVFISSDFVYDPDKRHLPQGEDDAAYLSDGYGGKKRQAELVLAEADTGEMDWTVLRPCHIYGPGSLLGCLPEHGRDPELIERLRSGEALRLVGGGHYLQQPILAADLARTILSCADNPGARGQICNVSGPTVVESWQYYQIIADILGVPLRVEELSVAEYRKANPDRASFLCHRIYDLGQLAACGLHIPDTPLADGLQTHVASMLAD
ncbi:MAG: NAD-dependent epimerase/dehydratase family protein [Caldilineaceae bacterium]